MQSVTADRSLTLLELAEAHKSHSVCLPFRSQHSQPCRPCQFQNPMKEVYPGTDGVVRNVLVKTKDSELRRSVQKCCVYRGVRVSPDSHPSQIVPAEDLL